MSVREDVVGGTGRRNIFLQGLDYLPGMLLLLLIGYAGKIVANYVPHTEYVIFAIAIGMVLRNTVAIPRIFVRGIGTYELWLKTGIVLMGARLALQQIAAIGGVGIGLVVAEIAVAAFTAQYLGRIFKLTPKLSSLIGIGVGICGVSAIIGASGAIDAKEEDSSYAIATILMFGAVMVFLFPLIGRYFGFSDPVFGFWAGLSVDNTAECVATGFAFSEGAGKVATIVKLSRNALMGLVILFYALWYARKGMTKEVTNKAAFLWARFPKFLIGFLAFSLLATVGFFTTDHVAALNNLSKWAFLLTFAGVGLSTEFSKMKAGLRPFVVGLGVETVVALISLGMVVLAAGYLV